MSSCGACAENCIVWVTPTSPGLHAFAFLRARVNPIVVSPLVQKPLRSTVNARMTSFVAAVVNLDKRTRFCIKRVHRRRPSRAAAVVLNGQIAAGSPHRRAGAGRPTAVRQTRGGRIVPVTGTRWRSANDVHRRAERDHGRETGEVRGVHADTAVR